MATAAKRMLSLLLWACPPAAQQQPPLDLSRNSAGSQPIPDHLSEQFIWTAGDAAALTPALQAKVRGQEDKIAPHYFRAHFHVGEVPAQATLYLAGPRSAVVWLNGKQVLSFPDSGHNVKGFTVSAAAIAGTLHTGDNTLAVQEVRGHSSLHTGASPTINQLTYGEVLLVKAVPREEGIDASPLVVSGPAWRSTLAPGEHWQDPGFDDRSWVPVQALGVPGSRSDFLQWNADAGLYAWPGYNGIGSAMRSYTVAVRTTHSKEPGAEGSTREETLDFGQEIAGRIRVLSKADRPVTVNIGYGESMEEAERAPYLGVRSLVIPARGVAFGPKSAFRYAHLTGELNRQQVDAEAIVYPVDYAGSFESSDPLLNRIWQTAAYTAHLCMQEDGIWDAPKRDRGRWMGDLDVTGRTVSAVFADRTLMEATMTQVIGPAPVQRDVNTIAGYSALWITGQADFYRHLGDLAYLRSMHPRLLELLAVMDAELSPANLFTNPGKHKVFVDWSAGFSADTPEARAATHLEFTLAYREAVWLLAQLGDTATAQRYALKAAALHAAAQTLADPATETFGPRWQTNSMAVVSGAASTPQREAIWQQVLSHVGDPAQTAVVTPYYGYYVLSAMAQLGHRAEALAWMRGYWGGMLDEGATSFWEAYDPHWPKQDFHAFLEADNKRGYYVSLAHGWSSGPAAWLAEQVLGIQPTGPGFRTVTLRPDLAGLAWAHGAEPTPRGLLGVDLTPTTLRITLPPGTTARVELPFPGPILHNGRPMQTHPDPTGTGRPTVLLNTPGEHLLAPAGARP